MRVITINKGIYKVWRRWNKNNKGIIILWKNLSYRIRRM